MAKIVVTDDDQDIRDFLKAVLEGQGHTVATASNREEGMQTIEAEKPDLIMLDVMMAGWQDGFEMARELKKKEELKDTPILMLTGIKEETGIGFKDAAGDPNWLPVEGFLEKPVQPDALLEEVGKLLPADN
jgi:CheY-like chemotaxis protein